MATLTQNRPATATLSNEEILRYSRHLILSEVGKRRTQPPGADTQYLGRLELLLPAQAHFGHDQVARVAQDFLVAKGGGRGSGWGQGCHICEFLSFGVLKKKLLAFSSWLLTKPVRLRANS